METATVAEAQTDPIGSAAWLSSGGNTATGCVMCSLSPDSGVVRVGLILATNHATGLLITLLPVPSGSTCVTTEG